MPLSQIIETYDARLRGALRRLGVSESDRDDLAQNVWMKLAKKRTLPEKLEGWIFRVARNEVSRHRQREANRRRWEAAAAELGTAGAKRPYDLVRAIGAVWERLTTREQRILLAHINSRSDLDMSRKLGYPTVEQAQKARWPVKHRIERIIRSEVDLTLLFKTGTSTLPPQPSIPVSEEEMEWSAPEPADIAESGAKHGRVVAVATRVQTAAERSRHRAKEVSPVRRLGPLLSSVIPPEDQETFDAWRDILHLHADDLALLREGELSPLGIEPDAAVALADMIGLDAEELITVTERELVAPASLRHLPTSSVPWLPESDLPAYEVDMRVEEIRAQWALEAGTESA